MHRPAAAAASQQPGSVANDATGLAGLFITMMQQAMEAQNQQISSQPGANILLQDLGFHPPGAEKPLLSGVNLHLQANQLGLIIGRSGSGKTTLLQLLAGLSDQTGGSVYISRNTLATTAAALGAGAASDPPPPAAAAADARTAVAVPAGSLGFCPVPNLPPACHIEERMKQVGLVFQFPERHFLGGDLIQELTFTWPRSFEFWGERQALATKLERVMQAVGLTDIPLHIPPTALSGGQQRRLALAIQLVWQPSLLLLDEPLAGLDWKARAEVVQLLSAIKKECTLLVVSHDLREIEPLVDVAWRMEMGGRLDTVEWPPGSISDLD